MNKKLLILFSLIIGLLMACSNENSENKSASPQQKIIDSLALAKENKAIETAKLKHELDSLRRHLDSIKTTPIDSSK